MRRSHTTTFIFILVLFYPFLSLAIDTITSTQPLTINQTLVSKGEAFELGFFNPGNDNLYIGIWYKQVQQKTYVWVANRDAPITSSNGTLTIGENGNIVLLNQTGTAIWSSNQSVPLTNTVAQLLDNGNFVVRRENDENPDNYIWQSFDYPSDTFLPEMKLGWNRKTGINRYIRAWKSKTDPGSGDYSFKMDIDGYPEIIIWEKATKYCRSGSWNGKGFSGAPQMEGSIMHFEFLENSDEISYSYEMLNTSVYSRLIINSTGSLQRFVWVDTTKQWSVYWFFPRDLCDYYGECGTFGICNTNNNPVCTCMTGYRPKNQQAWNLRDGSDGCVRSSKLDCGSDGFLLLKNMKLPEGSTAFVVNTTMNLSECGEVCKRNCSCGAYTNMDVTGNGSGCVIWAVDLMDMRQYAETVGGGQDLYVRVAASDLDQSPVTKSTNNGSGNGNHVVKMVSITISAFAVLVILIALLYWKRNKIQWLEKLKTDRTGPQDRSGDILLNDMVTGTNKKDYYGGTTMDERELHLYDFKTLEMATDYFSDENKLGEGGFGCVYKGTLMEGGIVAVKRLSRISDQGIEELKNEVSLIAKLQHRNLVRLLGCCIEVKEKLLIYEFMENKSLNMFLFDKKKNSMLNWKIRFDIICGIARGLLYLHHDSRFKIIHRDLKVSNILLDKDMTPKISDFGMARIFGNDQTQAETTKVVGTYGYMSPEYAMDGLFSTKSDVFSFGVLVLEIVSGKKNRGTFYTTSQHNLLGHIWTLWKEGNALEVLDESVRDKYSKDEVLRCIQIGLLCVQEQPEDRPSMSKVLVMLSSETMQLPQPTYPGFFIVKRSDDTESSRKMDESMTINEVRVTVIDPR
ncbi:receptor-like serine/threonine-protein kinase SD1-8 [Rutidosis leptorrhynchoides]|uniref:receptor-like serine/threonine-protein kinase SD1-8 n=1 Tax=Rutidosis leptorrhynchoides TaxID=125765 RepID=UPI003A9A1FE0